MFVTRRLHIDKYVLHFKLRNMESSMIEKLDKTRYNLIKWFTLGWIIWFGGFILKDLIGNKLLLGLIILFGLIGWVIFALSLFRYLKLGKIVNSDNDLKNALNDELTIHNKNKSFIVGYWSLIILLGLFLGLSIFTNISALIVCEITLYLGVLSGLVSSLIYNRA
jgi:hypothetical protein